MEEFRDLIRAIRDFPTPGVVFRDITPLLLDPRATRRVVDAFTDAFRDRPIDVVAAIESRGFIFGAPLALALGCGLAPVRKLGKLPRETRSRQYSLEYGSNHLEMHVDAIQPGQRVLVIDDVLATGGTARASIDIVEELGGAVAGVGFVIEIGFLEGRRLLADYDVRSLIAY
jgi:adenine phosphoribosyltransferase